MGARDCDCESDIKDDPSRLISGTTSLHVCVLANDMFMAQKRLRAADLENNVKELQAELEIKEFQCKLQAFYAGMS